MIFTEFTLSVGLQAEKTDVVHEDNTAIYYGSGTLPVYATPAMAALMEGAAAAAVQAELPDGLTTVGISLNIQHIAASPIGLRINATAELVKVAGRKLTFKLTAYDEEEKIGEGIHERFVIDSAKFLNKANAKKA